MPPRRNHTSRCAPTAGAVDARVSPKVPKDSALCYIGKLLHRFPGRRLMAMLVTYLDESGIHKGARVCAMAGFIAEHEEWITFERRWKQALKNADIRAFHMAQFENRLGDFEGWSDTRRKMLLADLIEIIKAREIYGFGSALVLADYDKLKDDDKRWMTHGTGVPYFLCFQHCVVEAAHYADSLPPEEKVAFVFDRQGEFSSEATRLYSSLKDCNDWPNRVRLADAFAFASRLETVPLQAADIAAYESYKRVENLLYNRQHSERWPMKQLRMRPFHGKYFDSAALQKLAASRPADS
jgi:hypothetical protein